MGKPTMLLRILTAIALIGGLGACSSGGDFITGGELVQTGTPTGTIEVINQTSHTLDVVLISNCNAGTYGLNRLPQGVVIPTGGNYLFTVSAGCWDVDGGAIGVGEARQRLTVPAGGLARYTINS